MVIVTENKPALCCFGLLGALLFVFLFILVHLSKDVTLTKLPAAKLAQSFQGKWRTSKPVRKDGCNGCMTPAFVQRLSTNSACLPTNSMDGSGKEAQLDVDLIVLVSSATFHKDSRMAIRKTWGKWSRNNTANCRIVFVLGQSNNETVNSDIAVEQKQFKDIVQGDFTNSYKNLTYQTMSAIKWATQSCPRARFVLKTEDDVWVNIPALLKLFSRADLGGSLGGYCSHHEYPARVNQSKRHISYEDFPRDTYPEYCSGSGYVMPMHVARAINNVSKNIPFLPFEDIYIGLCLENLGYHVTGLPGFNVKTADVDTCELKMEHVITSHHLQSHDLHTIWNHQSDCACPSSCRRIRYSFAVFLVVMKIVFVLLCYLRAPCSLGHLRRWARIR